MLGGLENQSLKDFEMFRAEAPGGRGDKGSRETSSLRQGEGSVAGWEDMLKVPGQAPQPLSPSWGHWGGQRASPFRAVRAG